MKLDALSFMGEVRLPWWLILPVDPHGKAVYSGSLELDLLPPIDAHKEGMLSES